MGGVGGGCLWILLTSKVASSSVGRSAGFTRDGQVDDENSQRQDQEDDVINEPELSEKNDDMKRYMIPTKCGCHLSRRRLLCAIKLDLKAVNVVEPTLSRSRLFGHC